MIKDLTYVDVLTEALERADKLIGKIQSQEMAPNPAGPGEIAGWEQELAYAFSDIEKTIKVLPPLRKLIPSLSESEKEGLSKSIETEGIRDPLILWQPAGGQLVLIDGHNRFEIALEKFALFNFVLKEFPDIQAAQNWMIDNQLGRRNLSEEQRRYLIGKRYQSEKGSHGGARIPATSDKESSIQNEHLPQKTVQKVAEELKVSPSTVQRADKFAAGVDRIGEHSPQLQQKLLSGQVKLPKGQVEALAEQPEEVVAAAVVTLESVYPENPEYARELVTAMLSPDIVRPLYSIGDELILTIDLHFANPPEINRSKVIVREIFQNPMSFSPQRPKEIHYLIENQENGNTVTVGESSLSPIDCNHDSEIIAQNLPQEQSIKATEPNPLEMVLQFTSIDEILSYADKHRRQVKAQKLTSSESDEWATPQDLWEALNAEFHFSLDVAATAANAKCARFFSIEDNGLAQSWAPIDESDTGAGWMNHPYSQTATWLAKAFETAMNGERTMVCLPKVDTSTNWWWDYCRYGQVRLLPGRYKFNESENAATFASAVVIFPKDMATNPKYRPSTQYWDWTGKRNEKFPMQAGTAVKDCGGVIIDDVVFMRDYDFEQKLPNGLHPHTWKRVLTVPSLFKGKGRLG